ncbi:arginine--tRNA ligase [Mesobacillus selenatarsenatis]|uniref:Arginine--tRNA ligase n=1 Tax=Mesobacillus selenatarsenatis (strain DSM 18680 / JCM 14380 / FERM P-15431 / SF-1) TaxID=1321606 RepID=A0A0A8X240_MESS1|nr:arginine--tRNA ligase [Mesobacillus selenatarsenatis]GAM13983.1 arginyl-tRNA synthetase [Mesobacillus selenatarsenatis SF-1]
MEYVKLYSELLTAEIDGLLTCNEIERLIEKPKFLHQGDLAFPCFQLAKTMRKPPAEIAKGLSSRLQSQVDGSFNRFEPVGGYINAFLNKQNVAKELLNEIRQKKNHYGDLNLGESQTITIDLSSPNIAKPFSMGHLRSTVIGNSLSLIYEKCGYRTVKINHLGDWGTQFGKLITAYKLWGTEEKVKAEPIQELLALYIKFHQAAESQPQLEQEGRDWFRRLENGDAEALELWKWFKDESLKEFKKIYDLMGIEFDSYAGEAFYNDKMEPIVKMLREKGVLEDSDGAQVVKLDESEAPCLIKKSDGATLYATRDLAAAKYRFEEYSFVKSLYVVGNEQTLHFKQIKAVLAKMDFPWANGITHVPFGMMLKDGKKMSTRKGKVVLLENVLQDSIQLAEKNIEDKNPSLANKKDIAVMVGTGAVVFHDLKNFRMNDIEFSLEEMLKVEGETGPYVQYTNARAQSLVRKGAFADGDGEVNLAADSEWPVITELQVFPDTIKRAIEKNDPSLIAKYVLNLSQAFNKYYGEVKILEDDAEKDARLQLVHSVSIVLEEGLRLLGLKAPNEM